MGSALRTQMIDLCRILTMTSDAFVDAPAAVQVRRRQYYVREILFCQAKESGQKGVQASNPPGCGSPAQHMGWLCVLAEVGSWVSGTASGDGAGSGSPGSHTRPRVLG